MFISAITLAALFAHPAPQADDYDEMKARVSQSISVSGIFMDNAQMSFDQNDSKEGCRQLRLARKELTNAGMTLNALSDMTQADSSAEERASINNSITSAQRVLRQQDDILYERCRAFPE